MGVAFNASVMVFVPKGSKPGDDDGARRAPDEVRTLSLANTDRKTVSGALAFSLAGAAQDNICKTQRGFVRGRSLLQNVVDLDSAGRTCSHPSQWNLQPCMVFFDFRAAFPSICREWIYVCLKTINLPQGAMSMI